MEERKLTEQQASKLFEYLKTLPEDQMREEVKRHHPKDLLTLLNAGANALLVGLNRLECDLLDAADAKLSTDIRSQEQAEALMARLRAAKE